MNKYVVAVLFIICSIAPSFSQSDLDTYSFVVVPDKFDFQFENDQYQLNSLTKFLLNKHGFHAFFNKELPNVDRCQGLWADVTRESGFIWTKVRVTLKDCNGEVVYISDEGRSKLKEYAKAYQEGIRKAFEGIIALGVNQKELELFDFTKEAPEGEKEPVTEEETGPVITSEETEQQLPEEVLEKTAIRSTDTFYENDGKVFILKGLEKGYKLYELKNDVLTLKGQIAETAEGDLSFTDVMGNTFQCGFNEGKDLVINTSFQELIFKYQR